MDTLQVAVCELTSINDTEKNINQILNCLNKIPESKKIDIVTLPENALFMRIQEGESLKYLDLNSNVLDGFKQFAKKRDSLIHIGATPVEYQGQKYNATVLVYPDGKVEVPYKKIHLFDIQLQNQKPIRESDAFKHGESPALIEYKNWKIGLSICYDLRFSELFLYYQKNEVDMIFIPSAFLVETGRAHWSILNRARAIESQSYVISAAQGGIHSPTKSTYGHSIVAGPWGNVLWENESDQRPLVQVVEISKLEIEKVRKQIPMKNHRRISVSYDI